jgi:ketosteroid isomerase-like protein
MAATPSSKFPAFLARCRHAVREQVSGNTAPFHELWAHTDDVVLMGAAGSHQIGWTDVDTHLTWAAEHLDYTDWTVHNLITIVREDLAVTIDLEHMTRHAPSGDDEQRTLRVTQIYRHQHAAWQLIARHGDPLDQPVGLDATAHIPAHPTP